MSKRSFSHSLFCHWVGLVNKFYYPHSHYIGRENIPADGNPIVMVGNHQNCMMDPVNTEVALSDRKAYCLTRGDIFKVNKYFGKFLFWLGLLPVNRMNFELSGEKRNVNIKEANKNTFSEAIKQMSEGNTLILFPESGHQNKRWLGYFSLAYLTLAFQTAEKMNFEKEIYIMPFAHHYGNYFNPFYDFVLRFGTPIKLSPYYERYKEHPRSTIREINALVEEQIRDLMLNITDLEHYTAIDRLREGPKGKEYAKINGFNPDNLAEKQLADKQLVKVLSDPEKKDALDRLQAIETEILDKGMRDWVVDKNPGKANLIMRCLLLLVLFPLLLATIPTWPVIFIPRVMYNKKINGAVDVMFRSTWDFGFAALATLPIFWWLPTIITLFFNWWAALIYFVAYPILTWFAIKYFKLWGKTCGVYRYVTDKDSERIYKQRQSAIHDLNIGL